MPMSPCMSMAGMKGEVCFCHWAAESRATEQTAGLISHSVGKPRIQQTARAEGPLHVFWQRNNAGLQSVQRQEPGLALETAGTKHRRDALGASSSPCHGTRWGGQDPRTKPSSAAGEASWKGYFQCISAGVRHTWAPSWWRAAMCALTYFLKQLNRE